MCMCVLYCIFLLLKKKNKVNIIMNSTWTMWLFICGEPPSIRYVPISSYVGTHDDFECNGIWPCIISQNGKSKRWWCCWFFGPAFWDGLVMKVRNRSFPFEVLYSKCFVVSACWMRWWWIRARVLHWLEAGRVQHSSSHTIFGWGLSFTPQSPTGMWEFVFVALLVSFWMVWWHESFWSSSSSLSGSALYSVVMRR